VATVATDPAELADAPKCPRCSYGLLLTIAADSVAKLERCFNCDYQASSLIEPLSDPDTGEPLDASATNLALGVGEGKTAIEAATSPSGAATIQAHGAIAARRTKPSKAKGGPG